MVVTVLMIRCHVSRFLTTMYDDAHTTTGATQKATTPEHILRLSNLGLTCSDMGSVRA